MIRKKNSTEDTVLPVPMRIIPADEAAEPYQTPNQRNVEQRAMDLAEGFSMKLGLNRREFLGTSCGMAVAFMAMNSVFGELFAVNPAEAADPAEGQKRKQELSNQFIFDVQTHCASPKYKEKWILDLRKKARKWNPELSNEKTDLQKIRFDNYYREVFDLSDTKIALLSSAPNDDPKKWFIRNDEIAEIRKMVNDKAGRKLLYSHAVVTPGHPGWMEELDRAITEYKPDAWKGYTVGTPFETSKYPWRLDDEKLAYPAYEKMVNAGIVNVCIHKGLLPSGYRLKMATTWKYGTIDDLAKAARDWPKLNFIIYHSAIQTGEEPSKRQIQEFEKSGHIPWVSELARMPENNINNVYAELGAVFANSAISAPRYCAGILGTLIKGLGQDHVLWGTDSVFLGSPQWQIEAFRRLEIPEDLRKKWGYAPLGPAGSEVKNAIFGRNAAKLYEINV
jgi:predicted TIM-barrel fold metal-dependent hydrolase